MSTISQSQMQKMLQRLSPQQIQMIKLLELPTIQLEQRIKKEIEENPALEEDLSSGEDEMGENKKEINIEEYTKKEDSIPAYRLHVNNYSKDDKITSVPLSDGFTLTEYLNEQLSYFGLDEKTDMLAKYIVGSLDRNGYLSRDLESLADDVTFNTGIETTAEEVEQALECIHRLEPHGIGARNLQEALLLQLKYMPQSTNVRLATRVVEHYFEAFAKKHFEKIAQKLSVDESRFRSVISLILGLSPKPANLYSEYLQSEPTIQVVPDFILNDEDGDFELLLNKYNAPDIKVSKNYLDLLDYYVKETKKADKLEKSSSESDKEAAQFIKQKIDSARWFMSAIKQRNATLLLTMNAILDFQKEYFRTGEETCLRPMILKDIADRTQLDVSTVSRVVNSKYIQTSFGLFPLKYFFSEAMQTSDGEEVSSREIKSILAQCVDGEDKRDPLTDEALMIILQEKGYKIARRTVAKYREMLNIPVARMRKEF